jgi:hypothetical protein
MPVTQPRGANGTKPAPKIAPTEPSSTTKLKSFSTKDTTPTSLEEDRSRECVLRWQRAYAYSKCCAGWHWLAKYCRQKQDGAASIQRFYRCTVARTAVARLQIYQNDTISTIERKLKSALDSAQQCATKALKVASTVKAAYNAARIAFDSAQQNFSAAKVHAIEGQNLASLHTDPNPQVARKEFDKCIPALFSVKSSHITISEQWEICQNFAKTIMTNEARAQTALADVTVSSKGMKEAATDPEECEEILAYCVGGTLKAAQQATDALDVCTQATQDIELLYQKLQSMVAQIISDPGFFLVWRILTSPLEQHSTLLVFRSVLQRGIVVLRFDGAKKPAERLLWLDDGRNPDSEARFCVCSRKNMQSKSKSTEKGIYASDLSQVRPGCATASFRKSLRYSPPEDNCFSLIGSERTLVRLL